MTPCCLNHVLITPAALLAYQQHIMQFVRDHKESGILPESIPDEKGEVMADGRLRIYVDSPIVCEFFIGPNDWAWRDMN